MRSSFSRSLPSLQHQQLRKKPRLGSPRSFSRCIRRRSPAKSKRASEMRTCLYDFCRRTRVTTYDRDKESGLDYAMARMYANTGGRFTSPDQAEGILDMPSTLNRYVYGFNDPINHTDPDGNFPILVYFPPTTPPWNQGTKSTYPCPPGYYSIGGACGSLPPGGARGYEILLGTFTPSLTLGGLSFDWRTKDVSIARSMFSVLQNILKTDTSGCGRFLAGNDWRKYGSKRLDEKMTWMLNTSRIGVADFSQGVDATAIPGKENQIIIVGRSVTSGLLSSAYALSAGGNIYGSQGYLAETLLHELAHVMNVIEKNDRANPAAQARNQDAVAINCDSVIRKFNSGIPSIVPLRR